MQPEPLIRILPHVVFDGARKTLRIFANVDFGVAAASQFDGGFEAQPVLSERSVPVKESRNHGGVGMQRKSRQAGRGARRDAEKIHKYTFGQQCIVIG